MECRRRWLRCGETSHLPLPHLALVLGTCVLALWMNPYGSRLIYFPVDMQAPWIRAMGEEWQSAFISSGWWVSGGAFVPIDWIFFGYAALLAGVLSVTGRRWRTADLVPMAVMGLWLALSLWHLRAVGDTVLLTAPLVAASCRPDRGVVETSGDGRGGDPSWSGAA
jgi:hypothetical protein